MSANRHSFFARVRHAFIPSHHNDYHPHAIGRGALVTFLAIALAAEGFLVAVVVSQQSGTDFLAAVEQGAVLSLTNVERQKGNLQTLTENKQLDAAAQAKADDMAAKGYFSHQSPDGRQPWDFITAQGYDYEYAGENLAVHFTDSKEVVNAWMASPTHRANILKAQYRDIGIGIAPGTYQGQPATYVVQMFGTTPQEDAVIERALPWSGGEVLGASVAPAVSTMERIQTYATDALGSPRTLAFFALLVLGGIVFGGVGLTLLAHAHKRRMPKVPLVGAMLVGVAMLAFLAVDSGFFATDTTTTDTSAAAVLSSGRNAAPAFQNQALIPAP